ncbi:MAG TPA: BlaI/MecI/CopY family transcriptional regulator [Chitinophagaceae bacterium]|jgi:BlaI family penicillinase repressor|nr:BlaI/MecI/CopY family transcriptional regulator [Chitinophagaceae bacterium]
MEKLTRLEEEIMLILWKLEQAFVKDIIDEMPEPKPHYNTISTMMKLLQEKQFVSYTAYGKTYQYFPLISKETYCSAQVKPMLKNYFEGSTKNLVSFFVKEKNISVTELEKLVTELKQRSLKR